jgi:uncharacterized protein (DUF1330 family)
MSILNINTAKLKNAKMFQKYISKAASLMEEQGVEVVSRGKFIATKQGHEYLQDIVAIFRFSSVDSLKNFYECERYQELIALRDEACEMTIHLYEEL